MEVGKNVFETENWRFWVGASSVTSSSSRAIMYLEAAISSGFFFTASVMIDLKQKKKNPFPTLLRLGNQGNVVCLVWETETRKKRTVSNRLTIFSSSEEGRGEETLHAKYFRSNLFAGNELFSPTGNFLFSFPEAAEAEVMTGDSGGEGVCACARAVVTSSSSSSTTMLLLTFWTTSLAKLDLNMDEGEAVVLGSSEVNSLIRSSSGFRLRWWEFRDCLGRCREGAEGEGGEPEAEDMASSSRSKEFVDLQNRKQKSACWKKIGCWHAVVFNADNTNIGY